MKDQNVAVSSGGSYLSVIPSEGGRLDKLILNNKTIIDSLPISYQESYASSILFPFVNRLKNGSYKIKDKNFYFEKNLPPNAIHGLVYKEEFETIDRTEKNNRATISLKYSAMERHKAYPFLYDLLVTYTISEKDFSLSLEIVNRDDENIPFNLGWHPYFYTSDKNNTQLKLSSKNNYQLDAQLIPIGESTIDWNGFETFEDKVFDDCFKLTKNKVELKTPDYHMILSSNLEDNYLQVFTPEQNNFIAIEPMTAIANSFNNNIGLLYLKSNEKFKVEWKIKLL